jgi:hypothetical protein
MKTIAMWRLVVLTSLFVLSLPASGQGKQESPAEDPLLGTWYLNVSLSKYRPGPAPKSQTRSYEVHQFGIRATVKTVHADGRSTTVQSVYDYGKQEHPVTGSEDIDSILVKRIDAYTHEATLSHAGHEIGSFRRVISKDGKQMTVTLQRRIPDSHSVEVYEKVEKAE